MKTLLTIFNFLLVTQIICAQNTIQISDFNILDGTEWEGQLFYKDFQSGEQKYVDAKMQINIENERVVTRIQYTYEPDKNETSKVEIKKNGTYFGSEEVVSNQLENGVRTIVTLYEGRDNGKRAIQYKTYQFNAESLTKTKRVKYKDSTESFVRNSYSFKRKK